MTHEIDNTVASLLVKMTEYCQQMQTLLKNDQEQFGKNDLSTITESNKQKTVLINQMNTLIHKLETAKAQHPTNHLLSDIETSENHPSNQQLKTTISAFKQELSTCYQAVLTNNNIVSSNLQHLKNIWDKLIAAGSDQANVYDRSGNTTK
jgi:hypothetical protein